MTTREVIKVSSLMLMSIPANTEGNQVLIFSEWFMLVWSLRSRMPGTAGNGEVLSVLR